MAAKVIKLSSVMGEDRKEILPRRTSHESSAIIARRWDISAGNAQDRRGSRTKQRLPIEEERGRKRVSSLPLENLHIKPGWPFCQKTGRILMPFVFAPDHRKV